MYWDEKLLKAFSTKRHLKSIKTNKNLYWIGNVVDYCHTMVRDTNKAYVAKASLSAIVGGNIRERRIALDLTQSQLAQILEVEVETISRYERGIVAPSFPSLEKLCATLQVPAWVLFSDGVDVPNATGDLNELVQMLDSRDRAFLLDFVKRYVAHQTQANRY